MGLLLGSAGDDINFADITVARLQQLELWSIFAFFRSTNTAGDSRAIISKWTSGASRLFIARLSQGTAPRPLQVFINAGLRITGASVINLNEWFLMVITNDGTGNAGGLKLYTVDMNGVFLDDGVTGQHTGDQGTPTIDMEIGSIIAGTANSFLGDIDLPGYVRVEMVKDDIRQLVRRPYRTAMRHKATGVPFLFKQGIGGVNAIDWSGNGVVATVNGTPTIGDSPPVSPLAGFDEDDISEAVAALRRRFFVVT